MSDGGHRRVGRPTTKVLTQQSITENALELVEQGGYENFTIAGLARSLKVAPSALYNHVGSKHDVLVWIQEYLMTRVDVGGFGIEPWTDAVRRWAISYRDVFSNHAPLVPVIATMPVAGAPATLAVYEAVARGLVDAGWPLGSVVPIIAAVESFIFGSALDANAPVDIFDTDESSTFSPVFSAAMTAFAGASAGYNSDAGFDVGLGALLVGLETRLADLTASHHQT